MKVLAVFIAWVSLVAARGSGPYLPSGWRPDGPAFYLPSEVSKPVNPIQDVIFQESEPSGSDSLREYGPPKLQEVTQDIAQQGLPDVINEKLFVETVVQTDGTKTSENTASVTEQKTEDKTEVKTSIEEVVAVTESQDVKEVISATEAESDSTVQAETAELNSEISTVANVLLVEADKEIASVVEPTVANVETQEVTNEASEKSIFESTVEQQFPSIVQESEQILDAQKETSQRKSEVSEVLEQASVDAKQVSSDEKETKEIQQVTSQQETTQVNQGLVETTSVDSVQSSSNQKISEESVKQGSVQITSVDSVEASSNQKISEESVNQGSIQITSVDSVEASSNQKISEESVSKDGQLAVVDLQQVVSGSQQESTLVNKQTELSKVESSAAVSQQVEVVSSVNESIQTVKEEVKKVEEAVQNIPEIIVNLENEIKSQQAETIQAINDVQNTFGSLDQAPEGFLEYGPPGFTEYGPPKDELRDNTIEEKPVQARNDVRKRRFSPKFRPSKKLH